jgi:hypothetical protein
MAKIREKQAESNKALKGQPV